MTHMTSLTRVTHIQGGLSTHHQSNHAAGQTGLVDEDPVEELLTACLGDAAALRAQWSKALQTAMTVLPAPRHKSWIYSMIGTGFDHRVRMLFKMEALPAAVPEPPPWHPLHLCEFPNNDHAERRQIFQSCRTPIEPDLLADIDRLTEMAIETLVPPFASLPLDQRHAAVRTTDMVEMGCVEGQFLLGMPDLICGSTLNEIKAVKNPGNVTPIARQLARLVLQDRYDRYGIRQVAVYLARQGVLVSIPAFDLFAEVHNFDDLVALRERYRIARCAEEELRLFEQISSSVKRRDEFAALVAAFFSSVEGQVRRDLGLETLQQRADPDRIRPRDLRTAKAALKGFTMTDVMDALRGWRVAVRYGTYAWASSLLPLEELVTEERMPGLAELARTGPNRCV